MQGLHSAPLSRFVTTVNTAKLTLEEAARLLTLLWRVSLPTNGQCTLHCEQVGGGTWIQRLRDATRACASVSFMSSPGPDSADVPLGWGLCQRAGKALCLFRVVCPLLPVFLTSSPGTLAALTRPVLTPGIALLREILFAFYT